MSLSQASCLAASPERLSENPDNEEVFGLPLAPFYTKGRAVGGPCVGGAFIHPSKSLDSISAFAGNFAPESDAPATRRACDRPAEKLPRWCARPGASGPAPG